MYCRRRTSFAFVQDSRKMSVLSVCTSEDLGLDLDEGRSSTAMAKCLSCRPNLYRLSKFRRTARGYTFDEHIQLGFDYSEFPYGALALEEDSYICYKEFFRDVVESVRGPIVGESGRLLTGADLRLGDLTMPEKGPENFASNEAVLRAGPEICGEVDNCYRLKSISFDSSRNISCITFPPKISRAERRKVYEIFIVSVIPSIFPTYEGIASCSETTPVRPQPTHFLSCSGCARDWPDARSIFNANGIILYVNCQDHFRLVVEESDDQRIDCDMASEHGNASTSAITTLSANGRGVTVAETPVPPLNALTVVQRYLACEELIEDALKQSGLFYAYDPEFGYMTTCPSTLGAVWCKATLTLQYLPLADTDQIHRLRQIEKAYSITVCEAGSLTDSTSSAASGPRARTNTHTSTSGTVQQVPIPASPGGVISASLQALSQPQPQPHTPVICNTNNGNGRKNVTAIDTPDTVLRTNSAAVGKSSLTDATSSLQQPSVTSDPPPVRDYVVIAQPPVGLNRLACIQMFLSGLDSLIELDKEIALHAQKSRHAEGPEECPKTAGVDSFSRSVTVDWLQGQSAHIADSSIGGDDITAVGEMKVSVEEIGEGDGGGGQLRIQVETEQEVATPVVQGTLTSIVSIPPPTVSSGASYVLGGGPRSPLRVVTPTKNFLPKSPSRRLAQLRRSREADIRGQTWQEEEGEDEEEDGDGKEESKFAPSSVDAGGERSRWGVPVPMNVFSDHWRERPESDTGVASMRTASAGSPERTATSSGRKRERRVEESGEGKCECGPDDPTRWAICWCCTGALPSSTAGMLADTHVFDPAAASAATVKGGAEARDVSSPLNTTQHGNGAKLQPPTPNRQMDRDAMASTSTPVRAAGEEKEEEEETKEECWQGNKEMIIHDPMDSARYLRTRDELLGDLQQHSDSNKLTRQQSVLTGISSAFGRMSLRIRSLLGFSDSRRSRRSPRRSSLTFIDGSQSDDGGYGNHAAYDSDSDNGSGVHPSPYHGDIVESPLGHRNEIASSIANQQYSDKLSDDDSDGGSATSVENLDKEQRQCVTMTLGSDFPIFPRGTTSLLARFITMEMYDRLQHRRTWTGCSLTDLILPGTENPLLPIGVIAGDAECYEIYHELLDPIIEKLHKFRPGSGKVVHDISPLKLGGLLAIDPQYIRSVTVQSTRNVRGFALAPKITRTDRFKLEGILRTALEKLVVPARGEYFPLKSLSPTQIAALKEKGVLFKKPKEGSSLSISTAARDWPDGRGIFISEDLYVWVNQGDHVRVISTLAGFDMITAFERWSTTVMLLEALLGRVNMFPGDDTSAAATVDTPTSPLLTNSSVQRFGSRDSSTLPPSSDDRASRQRASSAATTTERRRSFSEPPQSRSEVELGTEVEGYGFEHSDALGYISCCPSNLGTSLFAVMTVHLPTLGKYEDCLLTLCGSMGLRAKPSRVGMASLTAAAGDTVEVQSVALVETQDDVSEGLQRTLSTASVAGTSTGTGTRSRTPTFCIGDEELGMYCAPTASTAALMLKKDRVSRAAGIISSSGGYFDISNKDCMGATEVQLVQRVIDGVAALIEIEKKVHDGANVEDFLPPVRTDTPQLPHPPAYTPA